MHTLCNISGTVIIHTFPDGTNFGISVLVIISVILASSRSLTIKLITKTAWFVKQLHVHVLPVEYKESHLSRRTVWRKTSQTGCGYNQAILMTSQAMDQSDYNIILTVDL